MSVLPKPAKYESNIAPTNRQPFICSIKMICKKTGTSAIMVLPARKKHFGKWGMGMVSFLLALDLVIPLLVYMLVGMLIRRRGILGEETLKQLNNMAFRVLLPLSLFFDVYRSDLKTTVQPRLFLCSALAIILVFAVAWLILSRLVPTKPDLATIVQAAYRSNYVLFGGAICAEIAGQTGAAVAAALAVVVVPLFNVLAVILFEVVRGGKANPLRLLLRVLQNPLVDAGLLALALNLAGITIPALLQKPLLTLGSTATPLALVVLGGLLSWNSIAGHKAYLVLAVLLRLVIVPLVMVPAFALLGYRNAELIAVLAIFASPVAVSSTPMAQSMGGNGELAGEIVAVSAVCCVPTLFVFVWAMGSLGLIA